MELWAAMLEPPTPAQAAFDVTKKEVMHRMFVKGMIMVGKMRKALANVLSTNCQKVVNLLVQFRRRWGTDIASRSVMM